MCPLQLFYSRLRITTNITCTHSIFCCDMRKKSSFVGTHCRQSGLTCTACNDPPLFRCRKWVINPFHNSITAVLFQLPRPLAVESGRQLMSAYKNNKKGASNICKHRAKKRPPSHHHHLFLPQHNFHSRALKTARLSLVVVVVVVA